MSTLKPGDRGYDAYEAETLGVQLNLANWALTGISLVFLLLRLYCKAIQRRGLWWDDHFLLASWVTLLLSSAFQVVSVENGYGHHVTVLSENQIQATTFYYMIASTFLITASAWSKTSFAITLLRITDNKTKKFIWFLIISMNASKLVSAMLQWISCQPLPKSWNPLYEGGSCWDKTAIAYYNIFSGAYSGIADVILALLPWKVILALQMKRREKLGVAVAMSMGIFAGITAFVKCAKIPTLFGGDFTYEGCELIIWGSAETAATIMAASIPVLRVLLREIKPTTDGAGVHPHDYGYGYGGPGGAYYPRSFGTQQSTSAAAYSLQASGRRGTGSVHQSTVVSITGGKGNHHSHHYPASPLTKQGSGELGADDRSDKSILNNSQASVLEKPRRQVSVSGRNGNGGGFAGVGHGGIMQTNEVSIDYENTYIFDDKFDEKERHVNHMA